MAVTKKKKIAASPVKAVAPVKPVAPAKAAPPAKARPATASAAPRKSKAGKGEKGAAGAASRNTTPAFEEIKKLAGSQGYVTHEQIEGKLSEDVSVEEM